MKTTSLSDAARQKQLTAAFRALHHSGQMLILPNAWDAISARIFEDAGFPAVATTSSGVSFSMGCPDGEHLDPEWLLAVTARMVTAIRVPLTVDIEAGYRDGGEEGFRRFVGRLLETGAVGINLEDGSAKTRSLAGTDLQQRLIRAVREVAAEKDRDVFINARTDAMMYASGEKEDRIREALARAGAFEEAGADGIFVPFVTDMDTVAALKQGIRLPLNILADEHLDVDGLRRLGVNRISTGSKPILATLSLLREIAAELRGEGTWKKLYSDGITYREANQLLDRKD